MADGIAQSQVIFPGDGIVMRGVLTYPEAKGTYPAVMVHPGAGGMNEEVIEMGRRISSEGYVSLVIDLYSYVPLSEMPAKPVFSALLPFFRKLNDRSHLISMDGGVRYLQSLPVVRGDRIGVIGFCTAFPLLFACHSAQLRACVSFYNQLRYNETSREDIGVSPIDRVANLWCPWQGHYGEADSAVPLADVREFKKLATKYKKGVELYTYEGCDHVFVDPSSANYRREAAELAWRRTFQFLAKHLKDDQKPKARARRS